MKIIEDNYYIDLTTYSEIYQELVYVRNETIRWLDENRMLSRKRTLDFKDSKEYEHHQMALTYRMGFKTNVEHLLNRLYSYDAIEALYDFQNVEMGSWSDTETNRLERELQQLQYIIGKLEIKYHLQYRLKLNYDSAKQTLSLNTDELLHFRGATVKHRLMSALYSDPAKNWSFDEIEQYFMDNFDYKLEQLNVDQLLKAASDIVRDVAKNSEIKDFMIKDPYNFKINPKYIA